MTRMIVASMAATLMLAGCGGKGGSDAAVKRQPGSWQQTIEIVKLEGPDVKPGDKEKMQQMFSMMGGVTTCLTPEAAAKEDSVAEMTKSGPAGTDCTVDKRDISGGKVDFALTCTSKQGDVMKMSGQGTVGATQQDMTVTQSMTKAGGAAAGEMVLHVTGTRKGECTAQDVMPPPEPAASAKS